MFVQCPFILYYIRVVIPLHHPLLTGSVLYWGLWFCSQDGLRFKSLAELQRHTDLFLERKKVQLRQQQAQSKGAGAVQRYREWFCTAMQWISDFSLLSIEGDSSSGTAAQGGAALHPQNSTGGAQGGGGTGGGEQEEYVVPADELFTRCPVSREVFQCTWDEEEGEMMYRNACKVLLTPAADAALYKIAQPATDDGGAAAVEGGETGDNGAGEVRYLIVHKPIVMDQWLGSGRAATLRDAVERYRAMSAGGGAVSGSSKAELLLQAAGDDDQDDIFVLLELTT